MEILDNLDPLLKTYWFIAIPTSLIFLIQAIMTFVGADTTDGLSADFDGDLDSGDDTFQLFSLRNLINFLLGLSWTGIAFYSTISNRIVLVTLSVAVGAAFVYLFFLMMKQIHKLAEDNSFKITETLNKTAEVYLAIPEKKSGKGKIMISVKGSMRELQAITDQDRIPSGSVVKVVHIEGNDLVKVEMI